MIDEKEGEEDKKERVVSSSRSKKVSIISETIKPNQKLNWKRVEERWTEGKGWMNECEEGDEQWWIQKEEEVRENWYQVVDDLNEKEREKWNEIDVWRRGMDKFGNWKRERERESDKHKREKGRRRRRDGEDVNYGLGDFEQVKEIAHKEQEWKESPNSVPKWNKEDIMKNLILDVIVVMMVVVVAVVLMVMVWLRPITDASRVLEAKVDWKCDDDFGQMGANCIEQWEREERERRGEGGDKETVGSS
jgi:hypothetical protein